MPERDLFYRRSGVERCQQRTVSRRAGRPGPPRKSEKGKINVAIIGVGNCASSLVQGRYFYQDAEPGSIIPGIMHADLGGYHIRDINFVAAIDIDENKVGKDLSEAIFAAAQQHLQVQRRAAARASACRAA